MISATPRLRVKSWFCDPRFGSGFPTLSERSLKTGFRSPVPCEWLLATRERLPVTGNTSR